MDKKKAAEILQRLADGIDLKTGRPLPENSQLNEPEAIRALFTAIHTLKSVVEEDGPVKAGNKWSEQEEKRLIQAFDQGISIKELAISHERSNGAIRSRLIKLGKIEPTTAAFIIGNSKTRDDIPF